MEITLLGTGSPVPTDERVGTGLVLSIDGERVLVDCGPATVYRMVEHDIDPSTIETLFFTHHHIDHNADFFQFAIASWSGGRESLSVYGPDGTAEFLDALTDLYEEDIAYRSWFGYPSDGIENIEFTRTTSDLAVTTESWSASALPVEHSIETYAYRFEDATTGQSCVVSGDTRRIDSLAEFASGADVLVQDCCIAPVVDDPPTEGLVWDRLTEPLSEEHRRKHEQNHCGPEDAGRLAAEAGVDTLVLTHLLPYRDHDAMRDRAAAAFDGDVVVAEDGMALEP